RARGEDHLVWIGMNAATLLQVPRDRLAKLNHAGGRRVVSLPALERRDAGRDDRRRGVEVRLADLEVNDVATFGFECPSLGEDLECGLGAEPRPAACERSHG